MVIGVIMEYLVEIKLKIPPDMSPDALEALYLAEHERATVLAHSGVLRRMWRIPGCTANLGLWDVTDASQLHEALVSFPMFPYFDTVDVRPLAHSWNDPKPCANHRHMIPVTGSRPIHMGQ